MFTNLFFIPRSISENSGVELGGGVKGMERESKSNQFVDGWVLWWKTCGECYYFIHLMKGLFKLFIKIIYKKFINKFAFFWRVVWLLTHSLQKPLLL